MKTRLATVTLLSIVVVLSAPANGTGRPAVDECFGLPATIIGTDGDDQLVGTPGNDVIVGQGGDDIILGQAGDDALCGGPGNDALAGGSGNDRFDGGGGGAGPGFVDLVFFDLAPGPVRADLGAGTATGEGSDTLVNISGLSGSAFNDTLIGNDGVNALYPGDGDDLVDGAGGDDLVGFNRPVTASLVTDTATGEGQDRLVSIEQLVGSRGDDHLTGDGARNYIAGFVGNDVVDGGGGDDRVFGDDGNDTVRGGRGNDSLGGNAGNDMIDGGAGTFDSVSYLSAKSGIQASLLLGRATGEGVDRLAGTEELGGSQKPDKMLGDTRANFLYGNDGGDKIRGGAGPDFLNGGAGANALADDAGRDYCLQGSGAGNCEITGVPGAVPGVPDQPPASRASPFSLFAGVSFDLRAPITMPVPRDLRPLDLRIQSIRRRSLEVFSNRAPAFTPSRVSALLSPLRTLVAMAMPPNKNSFRYEGQPSCFGTKPPYRTTVAPPDQLEPAVPDGQREKAWWRGVLFWRDLRTNKFVRVEQTPWVTAIVQGPDVPTGFPNWTNASQTQFISSFSFTVPAGSYAWVGKIKWERTDAQLSTFTEPHIVHAPKVEPDKLCQFGG